MKLGDVPCLSIASGEVSYFSGASVVGYPIGSKIMVIWDEETLAIFFFCHDRSAPGNRGGNFICGYLSNDRYFIVFYCILFMLFPPAGAPVRNEATEAYSYTFPTQCPSSQRIGHSIDVPFMQYANKRGLPRDPFRPRTFVGKARNPSVLKPSPPLADISSS